MKSGIDTYSELVVVFQEPESRRWISVGRLSYEEGFYEFRYTQGAIEAHEAGVFLPFGVMTDFSGIYRSAELFPLFKNRTMPRSRPEYANYVRWLTGGVDEMSPLEELAYSGGARATDSIQLYPVPRCTDGQYRMSFFLHGVRHLPATSKEAMEEKTAGTRLYLMKDFQNPQDSDALALRMEDPIAVVGYCPRFLCPDFITVTNSDPEAVISLVQLNTDAPLQFRYRCELTGRWPTDFRPFNSPDFQVVEPAATPM